MLTPQEVVSAAKAMKFGGVELPDGRVVSLDEWAALVPQSAFWRVNLDSLALERLAGKKAVESYPLLDESLLLLLSVLASV